MPLVDKGQVLCCSDKLSPFRLESLMLREQLKLLTDILKRNNTSPFFVSIEYHTIPADEKLQTNSHFYCKKDLNELLLPTHKTWAFIWLVRDIRFFFSVNIEGLDFV